MVQGLKASVVGNYAVRKYMFGHVLCIGTHKSPRRPPVVLGCGLMPLVPYEAPLFVSFTRGIWKPETTNQSPLHAYMPRNQVYLLHSVLYFFSLRLLFDQRSVTKAFELRTSEVMADTFAAI